ncbi:MAG: PIN domain-containing protein [Thermoleophilia bacterium]
MTDLCFVDTNLLVYWRDTDAGEKQVRSRAWLEFLWRRRTGRLSQQVLNEYYYTVSRRLDPPLPAGEARADVLDLMAWRPLAVDEELCRRAFDVETRYGFSWWDSLIVAAARALDCSALLTEDLQHGQKIGCMTILDPYRVSPEELDG